MKKIIVLTIIICLTLSMGSYNIIFANCYTPIPTDSISPSITDTPTDQPTNNNSDTLPKTGESNNMTLPILGLIVVIIGAGFGVFKLKHK